MSPDAPNRPHQDRSRAEQLLAGTSNWTTAGSGAIGLFALAGWWLDKPALQSLHPSWPPLPPGNALAFIAAAAGLWFARSASPAARRVGTVLAVAVGLLGLLRFGTDLFGHGSDFANLLANLTRPPGAAGGGALTVGATFALVGLALLAMSRPPRNWFNPSSLLGSIVFALGLMGVLARLALPAGESGGLSVGDSLATLLIGAALTTARMGRGFVQTMAAENATRIIGRRLLLFAILLPPLLYLVQLRWVVPGERDLLDQVVFTTFVYGLVLLGVMVVSLRKLEQLDAEKTRTEAERDRLLLRLQEQAAALQQQVATRTNELNQLNERYQLGMRAARFGVWDWDVTADRLVWDENMLAIYGLQGGFSGQFEDWLQQVHPADRERIRASMAVISTQGLQGNSKFRIIRPDGSVRHLEAHSIVHRDADGRARRMVGINRDITTDHNHAEELRTLNQRLQFALVSAGYGVWSYDVETDRIHWDERVLRIFGADRVRPPQSSADALAYVIEEDRARVRDLFQQFIDGRAGIYDTAYRIRRAADAGQRHIHERGYLQRAEDGRIIRVVGLIRDVTVDRDREAEVSTLTQRLQFVVSAAGYGVWEADLVTHRHTWDSHEKAIFGLAPDFAGDLSAHWRKHVHPDDLPVVEAQLAAVLEGRQPEYRPDYRIVRPDGAVRHVATRAYIIRDAAGRAVRIVGLNRDITSDRELSERLRITEERWRLALSSNNDGVWDWDIPNDRYFLDQQFAEMLGIAPRDLPVNTKELEKLVHPDDSAVASSALRAHLEDDAPFYQCEFRMRHSDGHWVWMLDRGKVVARDAQNRPVRMVGTQTDITTRKTMEQRLRHNEELSLQLNRLAQIGAWELELTSNRITWAPEIFRIHEVDLGYIPTLESNAQFYPPEARFALEEALRRGRENGTPFDLELPFITARGHRLWVRTLGRAEVSHGRVIRLYGAFQDITARRDAEEMRRQLESQLFQAQKMETLGTLAGGIAHDFNNLLTGILGYQDLALDTLPEDHDSRAYLSDARDASLRARELVDQILTFSRQAGSEKVPVNLKHVVEDARRFLRATVPATYSIEVDIAPDCGPVLADATQVHQVLLNLGSNAVHAMRATGGVMRMALSTYHHVGSDDSALSQLAPGSYVRLDFSDTGHGMDEETLKRIFDPFFTTKEVGQGTGLGLSVVHGIMQAHHGAITVQSRSGSGTTFSLFFPVAESSESEAALDDRPFPRGNGELVAIVDDEDIVRSFAQMALEKAGYRVASFDQPSLCLEAIRRTPTDFAVLLTDQTMPGMKGIELAAEVRAFAPTVPVIIMSGYFSRISPDMLARLGHVSLLSKPFTNEELARAIHRSTHPDTAPAEA